MEKVLSRLMMSVILISITANSFCQTKNPGYKINDPDYSYGKFQKVTSTCMKSEFPVLIFTPAGYDTTNQKFPVVYMLHGTNDMPLTEEGLRKMYNPATRINEMAEMFKVIIVAPLLGNCYYLDSPVRPNHLYASFIANELTAFMDKNYKTNASREGRILCGFSMGGYGSVSLLCRYPDIFSISLARAGVLNLATAITDLDWDEVGDNAQELLGDYWTNGANYHLNSCFNLVNHIRSRNDIAFVIDVGVDDFLYKTNFAFHERLKELNIKHIYSETPGGHEWNASALQRLLAELQYFKATQYK
jgi:S-formylglutathione hydrolase FrmB